MNKCLGYLLVLCAGSLVGVGPGPAAKAKEEKPAMEVRVDARVELLSIIFRLAGNPEYNRAQIASYAEDVDKHFLAFREHAVVQLARKLRRTRGVSFDAPMSLAVHVKDAFGMKEKVGFEPHPEGLDGRWRTEEVREFLRLGRDFAKRSNFQEFLADHRELYDQTAEKLNQTLSKHAHLEWFERFFGAKPKASFHVVVGMLNGPSCYGPRMITDKKEEMYCILGVWQQDKKGAPRFGRSVVPTVVHEFGHSFVNPLVARHSAEFEKAGQKIYGRVAKTMKRQAYGQWETMIHESIVRAGVVRYRLAHEGMLAGLGEIQQQQLRGFAWVGELSGLLGQYEQQRDKYPSFEAFMPRIVEFFDEYASRMPEAETPAKTKDTINK